MVTWVVQHVRGTPDIHLPVFRSQSRTSLRESRKWGSLEFVIMKWVRSPPPWVEKKFYGSQNFWIAHDASPLSAHAPLKEQVGSRTSTRTSIQCVLGKAVCLHWDNRKFAGKRSIGLFFSEVNNRSKNHHNQGRWCLRGSRWAQWAKQIYDYCVETELLCGVTSGRIARYHTIPSVWPRWRTISAWLERFWSLVFVLPRSWLLPHKWGSFFCM